MWYTAFAVRRLLFAILFCIAFLAFSPHAQATGDSPTDTPTPVVLETAEEWAIGGGLLYWANSCFGEELPPPSTIKRQPVAGGPARLLETTGGEGCLSYLNIAAADDGVYYYDASQNRLEVIPSAAPSTPQPVVDLTVNQQPSTGSSLKIAGDFIYWPSVNAGKVLRVAKSGGPIETVADALSNPLDVLVVGITVYWTDSSGVRSIQTNCATLPCTDTTQTFSPFAAAGNSGSGLLYRANRFNYTIAWVERTPTGPSSSTNAIRQRSCSFIAICFNQASTFYSAASNWVIGTPVFDGTNYFWTERFFSINTSDGKLRRKAISGGGDPQDIAVALAGIDRRLVIANGNLYFAVGAPSPFNQYGVYLIALNASAITRDLAASAWEVTQAIQNAANAAPLIAGKTTYVRFYATALSGPTAPVVEAKLFATRNGLPLAGSPLAAVNGVRPLRVGGTFDRARLNDGWYFLLPAAWSDGTVALRAEVDPARAYTDPNRENNALTGDLTFQKQPPVCVWTVPVRTHTALPSTNDTNFWEMVDRFKVRWPVDRVWIFRDTDPVEELQVCWAGPFPYPCHGPYELEDGWGLTNGIPDRDKVIASLWTRALLSFNPDVCDDISAPVHFMGLVHPDANNGGAAGYASTVSNQSWVQLPEHTPNPAPAGVFNVREGSVMAQELGHNYGRKHVDCGNNPDDTDSNYPYPVCQIDNVGAANYYGFDVRTRTPIQPNGAADFMSYAENLWVSDYTWKALLNAFAVTAARQTETPAAGDVVFASGYIDRAIQQGVVNYLITLPAASVPPQTLAQSRHAADPLAVYKLRLIDAAGVVLHEEPITPLPLDDHSAESDPALFSATFAPPAGQVAQVQLLADATAIYTLTTGLGQPTVTVQQPTANAVIDANLIIEWTASDPDTDDRLLFTVQYSYDNGGHWHTLVTDFPGSPTGVNTLALADLGSLHASSGQTAQIRVLGSDGYHTAIGVSDLFSVPNRKPDVFVTSPVNGQSFGAGMPVLLRGGAMDAEEGGLSGAALAWTRNGSAAGSGEDVTVDGLAPGTHNAVLTATDAANGQASVAVSFEIAPLGIPQTAAPQLDGFCNDDAYASGVSVALAPYTSGEQASVALLRTTSQLWVCYSRLQKATGGPGALAGLRVDVNNSRDALAQPDDYGFFVGENGDVVTVAGDGSGGFAAAGPGGLQAQVSSDAVGWSAELRIDGSVLGGLDHLLGLAVGHYALAAPGDGYGWPFAALANAPSTWALTALGTLPSLASLQPFTATLNSPEFALRIEGSNFLSGTLVLWNGAPLPTEFGDSEHLTATVGAAQLGTAGTVTVTTRAPAPGEFVSNGMPFVVLALPPAITQLSPTSILAGTPLFTLTITGTHFSADAQLLWDGLALPTTFINSGKLTAQVAASLLAEGKSVGLSVRNRTPQASVSPVVAFEVIPSNPILLPLMTR
ncbi:MAG: hypothetical protein DWI57_18180 [Chloroflexi bacterium]|nr:MAG: hypothetical protein DWI57_18180 [Chloroflexota bacterium]